MCKVRSKHSGVTRQLTCALAIAFLSFLSSLSGCRQSQPAVAATLEQGGIWASNVAELRALNVSNAEIAELTKAHDAGLSDPSCVMLIRLARSRQKPFTEGDGISDLLATGSSDSTVVELARLNQLGAWAGEARTLRLAGFSDNVILALARRRAQGSEVLSGGKLGELKNAGASESTIVDFIQKGISDQQATQYIAQRERAAGGHGFVFQGRGRKKS
jgi:hypothetical protein